MLNTKNLPDAVNEALVTGEMISLVFRRRTDRELTRVTGRAKVEKHTSGVGSKINHTDQNLLNVFDMHHEKHKNIPLENVAFIKCRNTIFDCRKKNHLSDVEMSGNVYKRKTTKVVKVK